VSVVIIYPWTGRPGVANPPDWDVIPGAHGSTPELEGFRNWAPDFAQWEVRLFGLSGQTTEHQRELVERLWLPFPVLSDADRHFAQAHADHLADADRRIRDPRAKPEAEEIKEDDAKDEREQPDDCDADKV